MRTESDGIGRKRKRTGALSNALVNLGKHAGHSAVMEESQSNSRGIEYLARNHSILGKALPNVYIRILSCRHIRIWVTAISLAVTHVCRTKPIL